MAESNDTITLQNKRGRQVISKRYCKTEKHIIQPQNKKSTKQGRKQPLAGMENCSTQRCRDEGGDGTEQTTEGIHKEERKTNGNEDKIPQKTSTTEEITRRTTRKEKRTKTKRNHR